MKNFRLNSKSIVQRKARWLLTLIAILTFGVGQMWGYNWTDGKYIYFDNGTMKWSKVYLSIIKNDGSGDYVAQNIEMTHLGNTTFWYTYQGYSNYGSLVFRPSTSSWDNQSNNYANGVGSHVVFTLSSNKSDVTAHWGGELVRRGAKDSKVYFWNNDVTSSGFTSVNFRYGMDYWSLAPAMSREPGTQACYSYTLGGDIAYYGYSIANKPGWTDANSIYQPADFNYWKSGEKNQYDGNKITHQIGFEKSDISNDVYIKATSTGDTWGGFCQYYSYTTSSTSGCSVSFSPSHGTIAVEQYKSDDGSSTEAISSGTAVLPTRKISISATPDTGYKLSGAIGVTNASYISSGVYAVTGACVVSATFVAKQSAITFDYQTSAAGYYSSGSITNPTSQKGTYGSAMTALSGTMPSAKDGYKFQGFYDAVNGDGTKYYNADGTSAHTWDKNTEEGTTLYAYYEKAVLTAFTFSPTTAATETSVTVTPTITPASGFGTTYVCWGLYKDEDCTHEVDGVTFSSDPSSGTGSVTFTTPDHSGVYYVKAVFRTGSSCGAADDAVDVLNVYKQSYIVQSDHTVTVRYMCDGVAIHAPTEVAVPAASTSETFSALSGDDVFGYEFSSWTIGDGVTIETGSTSTSTIAISATFNGTITANYTPKKIIYFKNTLGWTNVYVNLSQIDYWDGGTKGSGNGNNHYVTNQAMTLVPGETNIYYYEYTSITNYVSFTSSSQSNAANFWGKDPPVNVVYPTRPDATGSNDVNRGFYAAVPMFVPVSGQTGQDRNEGDGGKAIYYDKGHWSKYDAIQHKTGYKLIVYNKPENSSRRTEYELDMTESSTNHGFAEITIDLEGSHEYGIKIQRADGMVYTYTGSTDMGLYESSSYTVLDKEANSTYQAAPMQSTTAGDYTFKLACDASTGKLKIGVKKPAASGDYRVVYSDDTHNTAAKKRFSRTITKQANAEDIVSFFVDVDQHPAMTFEYISGIAGGTVTWADGSDLTISSIKTSGVYNFYLKQNGSGVISLDKIEPYDGDFYIRTDAVGGTKWADYRNTAHQMTYSDYAAANAGYTHYWMKHIEGASNTNVKFVVANDYSAWISDTVIQQSPEVAHIDAYGNNTGDVSIRFSYNKNTNVAKRTYLANSTADNFLVLKNNATASTNKVKVGGVDKSGVDVKFNDNQDYIYDITAQVVPNANVRVKVFAHYNTTDQNLIGDVSVGTYASDADSRLLLSGTGSDLQSIRIVYDFKTNRMVTAWLPASEITGALTINADLMIVREHQGSAQNIILKHDDESGKDGSLTTNKRIYGVMRFNRWTLNNLSNANDKDPDHAEESSSDPDYYLNHHSSLSPAQQLPTYQRNLYYISFPFDVNVSDIFGFGKYGTHYAIQRYDGAGRAKNGYWIDSEPNWKWVAPNGKLNAYEGYVLSLSLSNMAADKFDVWANRTSEVELYFPSTTEETITISDADITIPALDIEQYTCTITRDNRNIKDSYWRCIGVPSYADFSAVLKDSENKDITWVTSGDNLPYLYDINWQDKSLTPYAGKNFNFKAMHSYLVQYGGSITWKNVVNKPAAIVAREKTADSEYSFRLELSSNDLFCDQTYVRMTDKEGVTTGFDFDQDMWKQVYNTRSNIYTKIGDVEVAGNTMPFVEHMVSIPVGVKIATNGDYTFSMPDGTYGVGVTLVDNETGIRTSLSALDYTINLNAGTYDNRFVLEISPIKETPTGVEEVTGDGLQVTGVRKVLIDGVLYIVKDGKMYDARGNQVK